MTSDNKIMTNAYNFEQIEIINYTTYIPLCIYGDVILMSNYKLYKIMGTNLFVIDIGTGDDYIVEPDNFTHRFVKINSKYYEIRYNTLYKIQIAANNINNIIKFEKVYYYIDADNKLILYNDSDKSHTIYDDNVNLLVCIDYRYNNIIYKKNNVIVCSKCRNAIISNTYVVNCISSLSIKKILGHYILDSDNCLYVIKFDFVNDKFTIVKILDGIIDFNYDYIKLYVLCNDYKIYCVDEYSYNKKFISGDGYFMKKSNVTKSANNLYKHP